MKHHPGTLPPPPGGARPLSVSAGNDRTYPPSSTLEKNATLGGGNGGNGNGKNGGYAHIWELRQNSMPNTAVEQASSMAGGTLEHQRGYNHGNKRQLPPTTDHGGDYSLRTGSSGLGMYPLHRDHVYESPKPARREDDIYNSAAVPYYHEFDASDVEGSNGESVVVDLKYPGAGDMHSRNNNRLGTFTMDE